MLKNKIKYFIASKTKVLLSVVLILCISFVSVWQAFAVTNSQKNMMHIKFTQTSGNPECAMLKLEDLEAGDYTVTFKYYSESNMIDSDYEFAVMGNNSGVWIWDKTLYKSTANNFAAKTIADGFAEYRFTITEQQISDYASGIYVGFIIKKISQGVEFYFADLEMHKTQDAGKTNLLSKDEYSSTLDGWYSENRDLSNRYNAEAVFETIAYEPYVASYFELPKTMLNVKVAEGTSIPSYGVILAQKMPTVEADTSYTFEFKYNQKDVTFGDDFGVYITGTYSTAENGWDKSVVKTAAFTTDTNTYSTVKLTFTPGSKNYGYNSLYIGFVMTKAISFYVSDIALYRTADATKKNLLAKDEYATDMGGWYAEGVKAAAGDTEFKDSKYVPYDETYFKPKKTMLHAKRDEATTSSVRATESLMLELTNLEVGDYTIAFKYNDCDYTLNTDFAFGIFANNTNDSAWYWDKTIYLSNNTNQAFKAAKYDDEYSAELTFTVTDTLLSSWGKLYAGFTVPKNFEIYLADFVMYKSDDATKTNLLQKDEYAATLDGWFAENRDLSNSANAVYIFETIEYVEYDAAKFEKPAPPPSKTMLHAKRDEATTSSVRTTESLMLQLTNLEAGDYTISFKYNSGEYILNNHYAFAIFANDTTNSAWYWDTTIYNSKDSSKAFKTATNDEVSAEYTFTITDAHLAAYGALYAGFTVPKNFEIYLADFVMYKSGDTTKTNLLQKDEFATTLTGWFSENSNIGNGSPIFSALEYIEYDAEKFVKPEPVPVRSMLHVKRTYGTGGKLMLKLADKSVLEANKSYTVSFRHSMYDSELDNIVYFALFGETTDGGPYGDEFIFASSYYGPTFTSAVIEKGRATFTFTLTDDWIDTYLDYYLGFYFSGNAEFYVDEFTLYATDDTNKTNLLPKNEYAADMIGWYNHHHNGWPSAGETDAWGVYPTRYAESEYLPFDETAFNEPIGSGEKTMLHIVRDETSSSIRTTEAAMLKLPALAAGSYTVSFKYYSPSQIFNKQFTFGIFGNDSGVWYWDKSLYESDETGERAFASAAYPNEYTAEYTFNLTAEQIAAFTELYAGFTAPKNFELYLADFVMYKTNDSSKTNLLSKNAYSTTKRGWYSENSSLANGTEVFSAFQYEPYDSIYFEDKPLIKSMLYVFRDHDNANSLLVKIPTNAIKADVEYTATFKYHFLSRQLDKNLSFVIFSDSDGVMPYGDEILRASTDKVGVTSTSAFTTQYKNGAEAKYTFSLSESEIQRSKELYVGIYYSAHETDAEYYLADLCLFKSDDAEKKTLLDIDSYTRTTSVWVNQWDNLEGIEYIDYDAGVFVPTSAENLYRGVAVLIDDGVWWNPEDVSEEISGTATVKGVIKDQGAVPVANVKLVLKSEDKMYSAITDENGYFVFNNLPVAFYELFVLDAAGNERETGYYSTLMDGDVATVTMMLDTSKAELQINSTVGHIKGAVYTADLETVSGLKLILRGIGEVVTDSEGNFSFNDVPVGEYDLYTVLDDGTEYIFRTVTVQENVELSVKLKYAPAVKTLSENANNNLKWIIIAGGALLLIVGAAVVFVVLKNKRIKK